MRIHLTVCISIAVAVTSGCATTETGGPVKTGDNQYKLGGLGNATESSGTAVKIRFLQQATAFCSSNGLAMAPGKSSVKDANAGARASAEVQFRCVPR